MLDRLLHKPSTAGNTDSSAPPEDCLSCRLVGGGGLGVLGSYILFKAYAGRHSMTKWSVMGSSCLGGIILSIATIRLMAFNVRQLDANNTNNRIN